MTLRTLGTNVASLNNAIDGRSGVVLAAVAADGSTDDSAAITAAINSAAAIGGWAKVPPGSVCRVSGITITDKDVRLDLTGVTLIQTTLASALTATSNATNLIAVTALSNVDHTMPGGAATTRSTQLTVASTTGYSAGDMVRVVSGDPIPNSNTSGGSFRPRQGEFSRVGDVDSTHIYLAGPLRDTYSTNVKVYRVPNRVVDIKGGTLDFDNALDDGVSYEASMLTLNGYRHVKATDTFIARALAAGITTQGCASGTFTNVRGEHGRNVQPNELGYGIVHLGSEHMTHVGCVMDGWRHGYTTGANFMGTDPSSTPYRFGRTSHMRYIACTADGCIGSGFDCHEEAVDVSYVACSVDGSQTVSDASGSGFACRGRFVRYYGCHVKNGLTGWQIFSLYGPSCADILLDGCSSVVQGSPVTVVGNVSGTAGGTAYPAGDVLRVRIRDAEQLTSLSGADTVTVNRGQAAVDTAPAWSTGAVVSYPPSAQGSQVDVYTTTGTWTKPAWAKSAEVTVIGSGAGGGSGARQASGVTSSGGSGGGGGAVTTRTFPASVLGSTEAVGVATGGGGGAAKTSDTTAGASGTAGGTSWFGGGNTVKVTSNGGGGGTGGQPSAAATAGSNGTGMFNGSAGGTGNAAAAGSAGGSANAGGAGGGAGGGVSATPAAFAGGNGGSMASTVGTPATAGTLGGGAGNPGNTQGNSGGPGGGGSGGGSNIAGAGGAGGAGGFPGGGGGGGGSSINGSNSGAGGAGGDGLVVVVSYP